MLIGYRTCAFFFLSQSVWLVSIINPKHQDSVDMLFWETFCMCCQISLLGKLSVSLCNSIGMRHLENCAWCFLDFTLCTFTLFLSSSVYFLIKIFVHHFIRMTGHLLLLLVLRIFLNILCIKPFKCYKKKWKPNCMKISIRDIPTMNIFKDKGEW